MKKVWIIIAIIIVVGVVATIFWIKPPESSEGKHDEGIVEKDTGSKVETSPSENQFDATVVEINDEYLMVKALDGQTVAGEVQVWIGRLSATEIPEMEIGDTVRITHDGKMTMSLPPQMSAVEEITIIY